MKTSRSRKFIGAIFLLAFFLLAIPALISARQSADPFKDPAAVARTTGDWINGKLSSAGVSVEVKEMERSTDGGKLKVQYQVFVKGAPKDQTYVFSAWPINAPEPVEQMQGLSLMPDGLVVCAGRLPGQCGEKSQPDDPVNFTFAPGQGEVFRLGLISADRKWKAFFAIVPDPIIKSDKSCSVEVIRLTPKFELTLVRGKGFQPSEDLTFSTKSYDETHVNKVKADANGEYQTALLPVVKKHADGTTALQMKGAACTPEISFAWAK